MKYSLVSDLHVNHPQPSIDKGDLEELIIVAGDTSNGLDGIKMLEKWKRRGHIVFAVDGNHEHYSNKSSGRSIFETEARFYEMLNQGHVMDVAPGVRIIGCNGWYPVAEEATWISYMNDHHAGNAEAVNYHAERHAEGLREELSVLEGKAIVVTHTAPCEQTLDPKYAGHPTNVWYWNPMMEAVMVEFAHKILIWHHGHTHAAVDKKTHGVRVVTNPRGYPRENPGWTPLTVEINV